MHSCAIFQPAGERSARFSRAAEWSGNDVMERAERPSLNATLAASVRLIRMHRRMRTAEVARAMGMAPRSYEHFEAGGGKVKKFRSGHIAVAGQRVVKSATTRVIAKKRFKYYCR